MWNWLRYNDGTIWLVHSDRWCGQKRPMKSVCHYHPIISCVLDAWNFYTLTTYNSSIVVIKQIKLSSKSEERVRNKNNPVFAAGWKAALRLTIASTNGRQMARRSNNRNAIRGKLRASREVTSEKFVIILKCENERRSASAEGFIVKQDRTRWVLLRSSIERLAFETIVGSSSPRSCD